MSEISSTMSEKPEVAEASATESKKPSITLNDIVHCVEVLRVCTDRGVWKANELSAVGNLYDRLTTFLTEAGVDLDTPPSETQ